MFTEQLTATPAPRHRVPASHPAHDERQVERFARVREALEPYGRASSGSSSPAGRRASTGGLDVWGPRAGRRDVGVPGGERTLPARGRRDRADRRRLRPLGGNIKAAGLHGVEVHGSHGWLVGQFLSPFYNRRDDGYGGSVEGAAGSRSSSAGRSRGTVGDDFPVGARADLRRGDRRGRHHARGHARQLEVLVAAGIYDFFDLSIGAGHSAHLTISSMAMPEGYACRRAGQSARRRARAVFVAGRMVTWAWRRGRWRTARPM